MKNLSINLVTLLLLSFTIPIQTKNSISNISSKVSTSVSSFFNRKKEEITHKEFNDVTHLEILCDHEPIEIESWNKDFVLVQLKKKGTEQFLQNVELKHTTNNHNVKISPLIKDAKISGQTSFRILVPKDLPIKISTTDGNVTIKKVCGPIEITTVKGLISLIDGNGTVIAKTVHGNITVQRKKIKSDHALNLNSEFGNITLAVPQDINADLQAHTTSGTITSDLFVTLHPQTVQLNADSFKEMHHHVYGIIGQPIKHIDPATILLSSQAGTIKICTYHSLTK